MTPYQMIFYFFATVAVAAVIGIFVTKNIFKAAIFLLICLLSVAAIYVTLAADFVAVTQILIYAAGIVVLLIFGIMLTTKIAGKPLLITNSKTFSGLLIGFALFALLINILSGNSLVGQQPGPVPIQNNIEQIGMNLMTEYALPFELAGILLLIALIGAIVTTSFMKSKNT
jgi:NADH:ubiquinone oxidoreductase subunit 6 (subunit J)